MFIIENKSVKFCWNNKELIEEIINQSAIHAEKLDTIAFEQCVLTPDNSLFFTMEIKKCISDLVIIFIKYVNIVEGSIHTSIDQNNELESGLAIKHSCDKDENIVVNPTRLKIIDMKSQQYIVDSVLLQWAKTNNIKQFIDKFSDSQFTALNDIKTNLFHLRILHYSKSYTFISTT